MTSFFHISLLPTFNSAQLFRCSYLYFTAGSMKYKLFHRIFLKLEKFSNNFYTGQFCPPACLPCRLPRPPPCCKYLLRFLFASHALFVNTPVRTRLRLRHAPVFTGNVQLTTKYSQCTYSRGAWEAAGETGNKYSGNGRAE